MHVEPDGAWIAEPGAASSCTLAAMALPEIAPLLALPEKTWRTFVAHLQQIGVTQARVGPVVQAVSSLHPVLRGGARAHHLRKLQDPAGYAMRMFLFGDPVTEAQAREALGDRLGTLLEVGFLRRLPSGDIVSPFVLGLLDDLVIVSDDLSEGGDAVMGFGDTTVEACRAVVSEDLTGAALDLGCGSGTVSLALADGASRVVATDINPRAGELTRFNALLNGFRSIDVRQGDLFAPVAGETFDLVVAQPPFVAQAAGSAHATFLHGGLRGDEIALSLLRQVMAHLAPGGRAVLRVDWPDLGDGSLEGRLRDALGEEGDLLVLRAPAAGLEEHATAYAAGQHPALGAAFEREVGARLRHFEEQGIVGVVPTMTIVQKSGRAVGRTDVLDVRPLDAVPVTSQRIDSLLRARSLAEDSAALLSARLRVPEGTVFAQEQVGPGAEVESTLSARFSEAALVPPMAITPQILFVVTFIHEAPDLRTGLVRLAENQETSFEQILEHVLPVATRALLAGLLEAVD